MSLRLKRINQITNTADKRKLEEDDEEFSNLFNNMKDDRNLENKHKKCLEYYKDEDLISYKLKIEPLILHILNSNKLFLIVFIKVSCPDERSFNINLFWAISSAFLTPSVF